MITPEQQKWIEHLSDSDKVVIVTYDPHSPAIFERVKNLIQSKLGDVRVDHRGSSSLGISGQDEIDIYIPVLPDAFDVTVASIEKFFGKPRSHYPLQRARFRTIESGKKIDIFVINEQSDDWANLLKFEEYLQDHPGTLSRYEKLKQEWSGLSTREYYRRKIEFINEILSQNKDM